MFSSKMREISYNFLRSFMLKAIRPYELECVHFSDDILCPNIIALLLLSKKLLFRVVMTVYFKTIFEGYHLKIKLLKKRHNFYFPAKCNN